LSKLDRKYFQDKEDKYDIKLDDTRYLVIRLDGVKFTSNYCKKINYPYDNDLNNIMIETTNDLISAIKGTIAAYTYSDEISLIIDRHVNGTNDINRVQKVTSRIAAICTRCFLRNLNLFLKKYKGEFRDGFIGLQNNCAFAAKTHELKIDEIHKYINWRIAFSRKNFYEKTQNIKMKNSNQWMRFGTTIIVTSPKERETIISSKITFDYIKTITKPK